MTTGYQIVVCGSIVPDPLQTLEPVAGAAGPALKNEMMLPAVLDPWAGHALYEAAHLAKSVPGSKVWLVSLGPKAKLQQVMMTVAQKVPFELVALDGPAGGFTDAARRRRGAGRGDRAASPGSTVARLLLFGGWESASRGAGARCRWSASGSASPTSSRASTQLTVRRRRLARDPGAHRRRAAPGLGLRRAAGACWAGPPGNLPEPPNNPQVGMANMRTVMPALQRAKPAALTAEGLELRPASRCRSSSARRAS